MSRILQYLVLATLITSVAQCTQLVSEPPLKRHPPHPEPTIHPLGSDTSELRIRRTLLAMGTLQGGIIKYFRATGSLPERLDIAFPQVMSHRDSAVVLFDAHQNAISYSKVGVFYILRSGGADKLFGTRDDVIWVGFRDVLDPCAIIWGDRNQQTFDAVPSPCPAFPAEVQIPGL